MSPEEIAGVAALFASDEELRANFVHERKREEVAGLTREEILGRMAEDYTFINRPVAVRGPSVACGALRHSAARYDAEFG